YVVLEKMPSGFPSGACCLASCLFSPMRVMACIRSCICWPKLLLYLLLRLLRFPRFLFSTIHLSIFNSCQYMPISRRCLEGYSFLRLTTRQLLRYNCLDGGATSSERGKSVHWLKGRVRYPIVMNKFTCLSVYITLQVVTENIIAYWRDDGNK